MTNEKKPLSEVLPEKEKENYQNYPDKLKSPIAGLKAKKDVVNDALDKSDKSTEK